MIFLLDCHRSRLLSLGCLHYAQRHLRRYIVEAACLPSDIECFQRLEIDYLNCTDTGQVNFRCVCVYLNFVTYRANCRVHVKKTWMNFRHFTLCWFPWMCFSFEIFWHVPHERIYKWSEILSENTLYFILIVLDANSADSALMANDSALPTKFPSWSFKWNSNVKFKMIRHYSCIDF